jgi:hypothetical protein
VGTGFFGQNQKPELQEKKTKKVIGPGDDICRFLIVVSAQIR